MRAWSAVFVVILVFGCGSGSSPVEGEGDGQPIVGDSGVVVGDGASVAPQPCKSDDDCHGDRYCKGDRCVAYGPNRPSDPKCGGKGPLGAFAAKDLSNPALKCQWNKRDVVSAPVVIDLDGDGGPEIIFTAYTAKPSMYRLVALRGSDCSEVFDIKTDATSYSWIAAADLDGDKRPEIVVTAYPYRVVVYSGKGKKLSEAKLAYQGNYWYWGASASIVNLDGKGPPEIVVGGAALRLQGGALKPVFNATVPTNYYPCAGFKGWGGHHGSPVADVDLDGKLELIIGNRVLDGATGADETPPSLQKNKYLWGASAVAQLDPSSPEPEVIFSTGYYQSNQSNLLALNLKSGKVVLGKSGGVNSSHCGWGSPVVADFDGDKQPEVLTHGGNYNEIALHDVECNAKPLPAGCVAEGVRWRRKVTPWGSWSWMNPATAFDFNGDGRAEVLYRDRCWMLALDGRTGKALLGWSVSGVGAWYHHNTPVVADVDKDGHAEIVLGAYQYSDPTCKPPPDLPLAIKPASRGILVLRDPKKRWMPTRPVWNQQMYHVDNINDDGTVPAKEKQGWKTHNSYRAQVVVGAGGPLPDLTAGKPVALESPAACSGPRKLTARLCNRGAKTTPGPASGAFFQGDPRLGASKICAATTSGPLATGACQAVSCTWASPPQGKVDLWFSADAGSAVAECREKNNLLHLGPLTCGNLK